MTSTTTQLPVPKSSLIVIKSKAPIDSILVLERTEGRVFMPGDSLQNMEIDPYWNYFGRISMRMMGFIKPYGVGPGWASMSCVDPLEVEKLLEHKFDHVLPAHGNPVLGQAWKKYEPNILSMKTK